MKPLEYEQWMCDYYQQKGYRAFKTKDSGDYGVDVFAEKAKKKIAVQVKKYGGTTRKINRAMIMELYGAMAYFDCTHAAIVTNGQLLHDAIEVARKLKVEIVILPEGEQNRVSSVRSEASKIESVDTFGNTNFDMIWEKYIIPLKGKSLCRKNGDTNQIIDVDWAGISRITSKGKESYIKIEIFKWAVHCLFEKGEVTRDEINQNYVGRASSGVILILEQVPFFQMLDHPKRLKLLNH